MTPSIEYYCPCLAASPHPPPPHLPSSTYSFHPLHNLFFCEECDAVRCNRCVMVEVSGYYCPNCLFEVPSASVRAEKNRCARNCFHCPNCRNTLTVVPSDPPDDGDARMSPIVSSTLGEPPFFLYCNHCRWDSAEVGITFEKPTGLAAQLQKFEDSAPESLEFERLKEHFEPFLRASSSSSSALHSAAAHHVHTNPITAAASSALARDIPGVGKYNPLSRSRAGRDKHAHKNDIPDYKSRVEVASAGINAGGGEADVDFMCRLETMSEVAALEQRWVSSWVASLHSSDLKPLRIPLQSKKSKRCPSCRHILIKPEQKAQSVRYKIKLVAANYLPAISVSLPHAQAAVEMMKRSTALNKSAAATTVDEHGASAGALLAGKTYSFHLAFTNPLYDPIQVRLKKAQMMQAPGADGDKTRRPPFQVNLPSSPFPVAAFAEAWEYEDDEEVMFGLEEDEGDLDGMGRQQRDGRSKTRTLGVVEKRANVTVVGGEVILTKEARGRVKFNMLVSYTYRSDDPDGAEENVTGTPSRSHASSKAPELKNFSFYTVVDLGLIVPREESRIDPDI
ncbi:hypothetical protein POSPLADRAFT_1183348 [Postia placenta MAD-698-R-SB12]|uniref:Dynactin subunit 4 n=1 Tax=Postia placenta MAD-698-R-SB12 TaxID=670580 RepID=A0A1X6MU12_9APHY|nr:hypothetical protein POSPLADRAFT_1183348 [Postia placenta MAD-698-R-SB12]OSX59683.1 hypothetical protein POSPLADRAFT_1183348 [Postia placenta MAD-698-R-SB12]